MFRQLEPAARAVMVAALLAAGSAAAQTSVDWEGPGAPVPGLEELGPHARFPLTLGTSASQPPFPGRRFAFINHPGRPLNDGELDYLAHHFDLVVIGYQSDPMIESALKLRALNPSLRLLVYFPTSVRQKGAHYGEDEFLEEWYLHDFGGARIDKGEATSLQYVDLTRSDYVVWARRTLVGFLAKGAFDGAVYDNANPIGVTPASRVSWLQDLPPEKIDAWNRSLKGYLRNMTANLDSRGRTLVYNGIHRAPSKVDRTLSQLDYTHGALNERFCYGPDPQDGYRNQLVRRGLQLEDIDLQLSVGRRGKVVLQKVNWEGGLTFPPSAEQTRVGNFCLGVFLMGHVPGYTFFKFGAGYNLRSEPEEYRTRASLEDLRLGEPAADYVRSEGLLSRRFRGGYVVVNLDASRAVWTTPRDLYWVRSPSHIVLVSAQQRLSVPAQTAQFFLFSNRRPFDQAADEPAELPSELEADAVDPSLGIEGAVGCASVGAPGVELAALLAFLLLGVHRARTRRGLAEARTRRAR